MCRAGSTDPCAKPSHERGGTCWSAARHRSLLGLVARRGADGCLTQHVPGNTSLFQVVSLHLMPSILLNRITFASRRLSDTLQLPSPLSVVICSDACSAVHAPLPCSENAPTGEFGISASSAAAKACALMAARRASVSSALAAASVLTASGRHSAWHVEVVRSASTGRSAAAAKCANGAAPGP